MSHIFREGRRKNKQTALFSPIQVTARAMDVKLTHKRQGPIKNSEMRVIDLL